MVYPRHWLLQFGGHQGAPEEIWSCGIRLAPYGVWEGSMDEEQYLDDTALPALEAWFESVNLKVNGSALLDWVKFNEIAPDGTYEDPSETHARFDLGFVGGAGGGAALYHPLQVAAVLTWTTDVMRGPANKGRIYLPRPAWPVIASGDVQSTTTIPAAQTTAAFLNQLDVSLGPEPGPVLRPSVVSNKGSGVARQITGVRIDSRLDVQRRRANKQDVTFVNEPVNYS